MACRVSFFMGSKPDDRLRIRLERFISVEGEYVSELRLQSIVNDIVDADRRNNLLESLTSSDHIYVENFSFERDGNDWLIRKEWDWDDEVAKFRPMAQALRRLEEEGALYLKDEDVWKAFWTYWQNEWTCTIQSDSNWRDYWDEDDFPLEHYNREKSERVFQRLSRMFGNRTVCSTELCFWFVRIIEGLP